MKPHYQCFVSLIGQSLKEHYPSAENQSMYFTALPDWTKTSIGKENYVLASLLCEPFSVYQQVEYTHTHTRTHTHTHTQHIHSKYL